ncbi:MAG: hypothetical protein PHP74_04950 [Candidatus Gracilibacteria bacterium]|nr:hypothetical protein [Candidatus Gracilibacteria bacterium]
MSSFPESQKESQKPSRRPLYIVQPSAPSPAIEEHSGSVRDGVKSVLESIPEGEIVAKLNEVIKRMGKSFMIGAPVSYSEFGDGKLFVLLNKVKPEISDQLKTAGFIESVIVSPGGRATWIIGKEHQDKINRYLRGEGVN